MKIDGKDLTGRENANKRGKHSTNALLVTTNKLLVIINRILFSLTVILGIWEYRYKE
jgi:hypothetical protein